MDPLTALEIADKVGSLAGTLSSVFKGLYEYCQNVKKAPEKSKQLRDELYALSDVAQNMNTLLAKSSPRASGNIVMDETVVEFEKMLQEMERKVTLPKGTITWERLKWPFSLKENAEYIERIERFKTTLNLALSIFQSQQVADIPETLQTLQTTARAIKATTQQTHKNTVELNVSIQEEKHLKILDWIYPGSFSVRHKDISARRAGSGEWFLNDETVKRWRDSDKSELLLCVGDPGVGKSFLSSFVIDSLNDSIDPQSEAVLFFYFDYKDQANHTVDQIAANFLKQLLCALDYIPKDVTTLYDDCTKRSATPDLTSISRLLDSCASRFSKIYLVLDALDEYQHSQKKLVSFLSHLKTAKDTCYKILSTTRPHLMDLAEDLHAVATFQILPSNPDLKFYINSRLEDEWQHDEDLKAGVIQALTEQKEVTFLLVRYQLDQILAEDDPQDSLNALENLPTDLWEAYTCILERIRGKKGFESAYRIFSWLYHAERPLQMGELVEALSFQNGNTKLNPKLFISVKVILRRCEGLVSYDRMSDEVRFMHFTVFEFLKERCIQNLMKSIEISKVCLKYLFSLTDVLKSDFPSQHERDLLAAFSRKLKKFKFVPYAVHYWDVHGKKEGENELELFEELVAFHETPSMMKAFHSLYLYEKDGVSPLCSLCWTCEGWTVLHLLAMVGLKRICQALFDIASNETPTLPGSLSPLADRVKSMANYCKQNIDKRCLASGSPLHLSALNNDDSVFRLLIHHGADIESTSGNQLLKPVHCAAYSNSESKLALLSSAGADMLHITADGYGPLYYAVQNKECVQFLLGQGAKPSLSGEYLLHTAAKQPDWEILKILIEADPKSINRRNRRGETPLHWAVSGPSDNLKYLLSVPDIELSVQDHDGNTPLHVAASVEHVALLLDAGLDLTITDRFLCTPLDHALIERRTEVARLLFSWTKCVNSARGMERRFDDREFSPVDLLLSRIKDHPCNWNFYSALGATYLSEGDVGMAKQFFDRSYFVRSELKSLDRYFHYCGECTAVSFNHERARYLCFVCEDSDHEVCLDCFPLLQTYHAPRYFNNHHFIRFPSDDYPSSISSFIQEWKENEELYVSIYSQLKP